MAYREPEVTALPPLEVRCNECNGSGRHPAGDGQGYYVCRGCEGTGHTLTAFGEEVFAFVEHAAQRYRFRSEERQTA